MRPFALSVVDSLSEIEHLDKSGEILTLNPELLSLIARAGHRDYFSRFAHCTLDSAPLTTLLRIKGVKASRYTGVDLVADLLTNEGKGKRILLYGAKPGVAQRVAEHFALEDYLALDGYSSKCEEVVKTCQTQNFRPDVILVALGGLMQFEASSILQEKLSPRVTVACGGSFDVLSGDVERAPKWMQNLGFEWAFRVAKQPERVWRLPGVIKGLFLAKNMIGVEDCRRSITFSIPSHEH